MTCSAGFLRSWTSYSLSVLATALLPTTVTLKILADGGNLKLLGLVLASQTAGFVFGALFGGVVADRLPRASALAAASMLRMAATFGIVAVIGSLAPLAAALMFAIGFSEGVFRSAYQAHMAETVEPHGRSRANAATTLSMRIASIVGPLAAAWLCTASHESLSLTLAATCWGLSSLVAAAQMGVGPAPARPAVAVSFLADFREGLAEARRHRWFVAGLATLAVWLGLGNGMQQLALPAVSRESLGGLYFVGLALSVYSTGALLGALIVGRFPNRGLDTLGYMGLAVYGFVLVSLLTKSPSLILMSYFASGVGIELFNIPWFTVIQNRIALPLLGRISALDFLVSYGLSPLSLIFLPWLITVFGQPATLAGCAALVTATPLLAIRMPGTLVPAGNVAERRQA